MSIRAKTDFGLWGRAKGQYVEHMWTNDDIRAGKIKSFNGLAISFVATMSLCVSAPAFAQDKPETVVNNTTSQPTQGLSLNLNGVSNEALNSQVGLAPLDLPGQSVGSTLFKLDISDTNCLTGGTNCLRRDDQINAGLSRSITSVSKTGLDFTLKPRASLSFDDDGRSALVGAVIEIGEDLREGSEFKSNTWYFFAGADAEALTYSPNSVSRLTSGQFHLQDRIIVGDAQAGLGYRLGDTDVSLSYMRREAQAEDFSYSEDAAALSFTWKR
ncbi:hypothetical protein ACJ3XI_00710 [Litorimonas sp. RW-G-Af-16]|uniref:hypothetical protein n=1 Tax=Litorimonas sp. RW-G-Af-16 TaxID=3241168 RepID=UPI00390CC401